MRERGTQVAEITREARAQAVKEGEQGNEPVYFGGADNAEPTEEQVVDPPPCGYELSDADIAKLKTTLALLDIEVSGSFVSMGQGSEPLIPLLLDERGTRHAVAGQPIDC
jgi:hypothetical protein